MIGYDGFIEMYDRIYADNAATAVPDPEAIRAMTVFLTDAYANASQPYFFSVQARKAVEDARKTVADCIGADAEEIVFTSGGSESDNTAIKSVLFSEKRKIIVTSRIEHKAVLNSCAAMEKLGYEIRYAGADGNGKVGKEEIEAATDDNTYLVSVMYANNELGTVQDIAGLCRAAHEKGALFHTDAVQAVGHEKIDVHTLGVDLMSASAHKFNGPKGVGFLYVRKGTVIAPLIDGGGQENGLRGGTENVAGIVGLAAALKNNCDHLGENRKKLKKLENLLLSRLSESGIRYFRNGIDTLHGLLSLSFPGKEGEMLLHRMDLCGICVSTGSACDGRKTGISHVLKAVGMEKERAVGTIRISLGKYNTEEEVLRIADALRKIAGEE